MKPGRIPALLAIAALALIGCFRNDNRLAGGWADTETGHKVAGLVVRPDGTAAAGALVLLRPADYLGRDPLTDDSLGVSPSGGTIADLTCDSSGHFRIDSVAPGRYALESRYQEINASLVRFEMGAQAARMDLGSQRTKPVGSITGRVRFSDDVPGPALVRIRGLERAALADPATGVYTFGNLPEGEYTLHYEGLEPLVTPADKSGVRFGAGLGANAGETVLQRGLRQPYALSDGFLELPGVDSTNPVLLENGSFRSPMDGAYLFAKASLGRLDLRGVIASYGRDTGDAAIAANVRACAHQIGIARLSGMRVSVTPTAGARRPLPRPRGGNLMDIVSDASAGALLLISEAEKATSARPLVLICGTNLTTVAQALLLRPGIADRLVVFGANNGNINADDSLASALVAHKARLVAWSREHYWDTTYATKYTPDHIPGRIGEALRGLYNPVAFTRTWAYSYYGDFGPATYLYRRAVWRSAVPSLYGGPPLKAIPTAQPVYDFLDIPFAANDWSAMEAEFYSAVDDSAAYRPWPVPGAVEAEAYSVSARIAVDSLPGGECVAFKDPGAFTEYSLQSETSRDFVLELTYRADAAAELRVSLDVGATGSVPVTVALPAAKDGGTAQAAVRFEAGRRRLRVDHSQGAFTLDRIQAR